MRKRRKFALDTAPGKELLAPIRNHGDIAAFAEFYRQRRDWWGYPYMNDGLITYGIFADLTIGLSSETSEPELSLEKQGELLPTSVFLAEQETDRFFLCSLSLILAMIDGLYSVKSPEDIRSRIKGLHPRAKRLSYFANISSVWNGLVEKVFDIKERQTLLVDDEDWRAFVSFEFPTVDGNGWRNCPGGEDAVREEISGISGGEFVLEFVRSARFENSKYWIWLYRNISQNPIWHFYLFITTTDDGKTELHRHSMHSVVNISPEDLIVRHAYGVLN